MNQNEANKIRLTDDTLESYHALWQQYVTDSMMLDGEYHLIMIRLLVMMIIGCYLTFKIADVLSSVWGGFDDR